MITAVDTNVLLDVLLPNDQFVDASARALTASAASGPLVVCAVVYAELSTAFSSRRLCDSFLDDNEIQVVALTRDVGFQASRAWRLYRRQGGRRSRILSDFLIGAHAELDASCLLTRDRGFYRKLFPGLTVLEPT